MTGHQDATYRYRVAVGFLDEARQDVETKRWRSAVDNAQLAVESAAKAALALTGPVGSTHAPAARLLQALGQGQFPASCAERVRRLAEKAALLGPDVHVQTDYGDEVGGAPPGSYAAKGMPARPWHSRKRQLHWRV